MVRLQVGRGWPHARLQEGQLGEARGVRVGAVFADYDGTLAPLGVPRDESRIFRRVEQELRAIAAVVPVCVVTAKDYDFVSPRSSFAAGWACVSGLDVRLADGRGSTYTRLVDLGPALKVAEASEKLGAYIEFKRGPKRELLALAIDWSGVPEAGQTVVRRLRGLSGSGLRIHHDRRTTFADIYAGPPDKGRATKILKRMLMVQSYVMFIGDSALDNTAFQQAGISIGVAHDQPMSELRCDFVVEQARLAEFLRSLRGHGMEFTPTMPAVRRRGELILRESRSHNVSDQPHEGAGAGRPEDGKGVQAPGTRGLPNH